MCARTRCGLLTLAILVMVPESGAEEGAKPLSPRQQYEALVREYQVAVDAWDKRGRSSSPRDPFWIEHYQAWPMWTFAPRFLEFAEANPKAGEAVDALLRVVEFTRTGRSSDRALFPVVTRAFARLTEHHLHDERVAQACLKSAKAGGPGVEAYLRALIARAPDRDVRAYACWGLVSSNGLRLSIARRPFFDHPEDRPEYRQSAGFLRGRVDPEYVNYIKATDAAAVSAEIEGLLERLIAEYADVPWPPRWVPAKGERPRLGELAGRKLDARRHLAVGMVAPEIQGEDIDGKPMKLSDYRGKVVVLVFWGTWCGPCMGFLPQEKALVNRLEDRPFVLLGINSDTDRQKLKARVAKEGISWRSWWDGGGTSGPIASRWDVHAWPTIVLLDHEGVIRANRVSRKPMALDELVDTLVNAVPR